jgi:ribonuclease-3
MRDQPSEPESSDARPLDGAGAAGGHGPAGSPAPSTAASVAVLQEALGHPFADPALLVEALTHRSYVHEFGGPGVASNERLEFLGDAVLALVSADLLFALAPASSEGELTAVRAALVRESTLATFARSVGLGAHLRLGRGEELTGGRDRDLLLASALEAVVGALYLDGGLPAARAFVQPFLLAAARRVLASRQYKDDKSRLQELAQAQLGVTPAYRLVSAEGPSHEPRFAVEVLLGERVAARGEGRSKRQAEQAAAKEALRDPGWRHDGAAPGD